MKRSFPILIFAALTLARAANAEGTSRIQSPTQRNIGIVMLSTGIAGAAAGTMMMVIGFGTRHCLPIGGVGDTCKLDYPMLGPMGILVTATSTLLGVAGAAFMYTGLKRIPIDSNKAIAIGPGSASFEWKF